ncbi:MAG: ATP-binding protein, partial [Erysipelotrichaceae bacterium]|nr:ATP-binding protein [Erysipelotrichaceae bacterium]
YLVDNGIPFNPLENDDPDIDVKLEDRQIGGLGIYMVKKSMDSCRYERKGTQNRFIMSRRIKG